MLRSILLKLSESKGIAHWVTTNASTRRMSHRCVAGETLDEALQAARACNDAGMMATLDYLGGNVSTTGDAQKARDAYLEIFDRIAQEKLNANVSCKLTQLGLDLSVEFCEGLVLSIAERASTCDSFLRIDMEGSIYTQRTIELVKRVRAQTPTVGTVLQSYLHPLGPRLVPLLYAPPGGTPGQRRLLPAKSLPRPLNFFNKWSLGSGRDAGCTRLSAQTFARMQRVNLQPRDVVSFRGQLLGRSSQHGKRRIVHRNHVLHAQQANRKRCLARPHCEDVADRQASDVGFVDLPDEFHVAKNGGVTRVIQRHAAGQPHDIAARFPCVQPFAGVLDGIGVKRVGHRNVEIANLLRAAFVAGKRLRAGPLRFQPEVRFKRRHHFRFVLFGQSEQVTQMVRMAVRQEDGIQPRQLLQVLRAARIRVNPGIDEGKLPAGCLQAKGAVPEIGDRVAFQIQHGFSSMSKITSRAAF